MADFTPLNTPNSWCYWDTSITSSISEDDTAGDASQCDDLTGNGRHLVQPNSDLQLQTGVTTWNSENIITNYVGGSDAYMRADITGLNNTFTIVFVGSSSAGQATDSSLFSMLNNFLLSTVNIQLNVEVSGAVRSVVTDGIGGADTASGSTYDDIPTIITMEADATAGTLSLHLNGTLIGSSSSYNGELNASLFRLFLADRDHIGLVGEFGGAIIYPYISSDLRQRNEGYFAHLFDLLSTLDASHPYKVTGPTDASIPNPTAIYLTEPTYGMVYSRVHGTTAANVPVDYTYTGASPTAVQARVVNQDTRAEIVTWATIDASPSGGGGTGTLSVPQITTGIAYALEIRTTDAPSTVDAGVSKFYVGIWFWVYGQSGANRLDYYIPLTGEAIQEGHVFYNSADFIQPNAAGAIKMGNEILNLTSLPSGHVNRSPSGVKLEAIDNQGDTTYFDAAVASMVGSGQKPEFILLNEVHGDSVQPTPEATYFNLLEQLHLDMVDAVGLTTAQCPMILCSITTWGIGNYNDNGWSRINNTAQYCADQLPDVYYLNIVDADLIPDDGHNSAEGNATVGKRAAYQFSQLTAPVEWEITEAQTISDTTMDITVAFGTGSAFSPTTGITGFEVSNDDFVTPVTATGAKWNNNTIRLTFSSLAGDLKVRHLYGLEPDLTGLVYDNSTDPIPLNQLLEMEAGGPPVAILKLTGTSGETLTTDTEAAALTLGTTYDVEVTMTPLEGPDVTRTFRRSVVASFGEDFGDGFG